MAVGKNMKLVLALAVILVLLIGVYFLMGGRLEGFNTPTTVTFYFLPGCGWCDKFKPEWAKFKPLAEKEGIKTVEVNANEQKELVEKKGITGFPTIKVEKNGKEVDFTGDRTADALLAFAKSA